MERVEKSILPHLDPVHCIHRSAVKMFRKDQMLGLENAITHLSERMDDGLVFGTSLLRAAERKKR